MKQKFVFVLPIEKKLAKYESAAWSAQKAHFWQNRMFDSSPELL
jgi:hypothetical protein